MSYETEQSLDEIAEELAEGGEPTLTFDAGSGDVTLEEASAFLTALAEFENFETPPQEVEITLRG